MISAACWPSTPQMERRNPELSELLMVEMAPAPGVKLIRVPAPTRASQSEICTNPAYARRTLNRLPNGSDEAELLERLVRRYERQAFDGGLGGNHPVEGIPM